MQVNLKWTGGMTFEAQADDNKIMMDAKAPLGKGSAMTPKELVAAGLAGCSAVDVVGLLRKHRQGHTHLDVVADITSSKGDQPIVFTGATLTFSATGEVDKDVLLEAVHLSQTKYCGVSAMLAQSFPIQYIVQLNGEVIGTGRADFSKANFSQKD